MVVVFVWMPGSAVAFGDWSEFIFVAFIQLCVKEGFVPLNASINSHPITKKEQKSTAFVHKNASFTCTSPRETFLLPFNTYFQVGAINIQYLIFSSFHYTSVPVMKAGFEIWLIFLRSGEANRNTHTCIENRGSAVKDQKQCGELASLFDIGKPGWILLLNTF